MACYLVTEKMGGIIVPKAVSILRGKATSQADMCCIGGHSFSCAVVLCDMKWLDPDEEVANGISATEQSDMLRLDALVLMAQLNIRKLIEVPATTRTAMLLVAISLLNTLMSPVYHTMFVCNLVVPLT